MANPYTIAGPTISVANTATVSLALTGDGSSFSPYMLQADAFVSLDELTDVEAPTPAAGQVLTWTTTPTPGWRPAPGNAAGPGTINIDPNTLHGDGSGGAPLSVLLDPAGNITSGPAGLAVPLPATPGWADFATTWMFDQSNGALNDGQMLMRHRDEGNTCHCRFALVFGPNTSGGFGNWAWTLPHTAANPKGWAVSPAIGADAYIGSAQLYQPGWMWSTGIVRVAAGMDRAWCWALGDTQWNSTWIVRNADASGRPGTGVPTVPNNWSFTNGGFVAWNVEFEF